MNEAGDIDQNVEPAEHLRGVTDGLLAGLARGDVAGKRMMARPERACALGDGFTVDI